MKPPRRSTDSGVGPGSSSACRALARGPEAANTDAVSPGGPASMFVTAAAPVVSVSAAAMATLRLTRRRGTSEDVDAWMIEEPECQLGAVVVELEAEE